MGLFGFGAAPSKPVEEKFIFATGEALTPEQYGYLAVRLGYQSAVEQVDAWFGEGTLGASLGLAKAIRNARFAADVYTAMLEVGVYLWYAASMLRVTSAVMERASMGVRDCLGNLRDPHGRALEPDFTEFLLQQAYGFALLVEKDGDELVNWDAGVIRVHPLPSTALLLDILHRSNSADPLDIEKWKLEQHTAAGTWLRLSIDSSTRVSIEILEKEFRIRFEG